MSDHCNVNPLIRRDTVIRYCRWWQLPPTEMRSHPSAQHQNSIIQNAQLLRVDETHHNDNIIQYNRDMKKNHLLLSWTHKMKQCQTIHKILDIMWKKSGISFTYSYSVQQSLLLPFCYLSVHLKSTLFKKTPFCYLNVHLKSTLSRRRTLSDVMELFFPSFMRLYCRRWHFTHVASFLLPL